MQHVESLLPLRQSGAVRQHHKHNDAGTVNAAISLKAETILAAILRCTLYLILLSFLVQSRESRRLGPAA
jgi:hypothetical protein